MSSVKTHIGVRMDDDDRARLDRLVGAVRSYYENLAKTQPVAARLAEEVTRSSALRDLLVAWDRGIVDEMAPRALADSERFE